MSLKCQSVNRNLWRTINCGEGAGGLSERRIAPFGCGAVVKPESAVCLTQWGVQILGPRRGPAGASSLATGIADMGSFFIHSLGG